MMDIKRFSVKQKSKNWLNFLIGGAVLLFLLVFINLFVSPIRDSFYILSTPIQKTFWTAGESSSSFLGSFFKAGSLVKENENLKQENQNLLSQISFLKAIEQGNQAQSDISLACQNNGFESIMVGVVGLDDNDIVSINKGSADGISKGMPVVNQQHVLFGKILEVTKNFSKIMLISNKTSVINVEIQQNPEITGVIKGNGGLGAYLDLIPINNEIKQGDVLVTSSLEKTFPKNLLVGKINKVEKNDQKSFQQAQVDLFFNVKTADNLFVITNYKQN